MTGITGSRISATLVLALLGLIFKAGAAPYLDPTAKTNVNKVDPLFRESVSDYDSYERSIDDMANAGIENARNEQGYRDLAGGREADAKAADLSNIGANDLHGRGQEEYMKDPGMSDIFVDYSKPGMIRHREDAKIIADATARLHDNLFAHLKDLKVNCRTIKGNRIIDPEYFIELHNSVPHGSERRFGSGTGDTVYDKYMCEQLRNIYSCTDTLKLTCTSKSSGNYRAETIRLSFSEMPSHWWHGIPGKGFSNFFPLAEVMAEVKAKISEKTGHQDIVVPDQEIMIYQDVQVLYQLDSAGTPGTVQGTWHPDPEPVTDSIRFFYKIAQEEKCTHWHEDRTERCSLK